MSHYTYHPTMTVRTAQWLRALLQDPAAPRGRGPTGARALKLGWTDYLVELKDGTRTTWDALPTPHPDFEIVGEVVTEAGKAVLAEYESGQHAEAA